ncbi:DNA-formamidopyrimidine glycosylase [Rufibacter glacialis]|uniref:Formamidopyrimidine-DNA glycosylase n=1 Tax=Rufibacter glacialis TaxID=1259555 RepID=A0A5M8Q532_9BACT|nr:DNA-formamidopyrimidine glycosylase [Rufibacter glacialis]KAA6430241.1 DNA-formamidopyrimidine glycosylase [Rufibacter glacialis]GGK87639.1 formamidopyrimidine-DNA glycosylase [Rufibacter glacialis]
MPELPEVETYRRFIEETSLHQTIAEVEVQDPRRQLQVDLDEFRQVLRGNQFTQTHRIGKQLFLLTAKGPIVTLHFGMTGDVAFYRDEADTPRFARAVFHFEGGFKFAFLDSRKFGRLGLTQSIDTFRQQKKLGPDALTLSTEELSKGLAKKKSAIKPLLLDQRIAPGVGNWIADEVLFQAQLEPERPAHTLLPPEVDRLATAIREVLETAIAAEAVYRDFPSHYLIHAREWDEAPVSAVSEAHLHCPRCQTRIQKKYVGGRATYFCPGCQL